MFQRKIYITTAAVAEFFKNKNQIRFFSQSEQTLMARRD